MSDTRLVEACPECDTAGKFYQYGRGGKTRCRRCGALFDEPIRRPPKNRPTDGYTDDDLPTNCAVKEQLRDLRSD